MVSISWRGRITVIFSPVASAVGAFVAGVSALLPHPASRQVIIVSARIRLIKRFFIFVPPNYFW